MSDRFYRAFEDKYRGSRELIKSRLEAYLPYLEPFKKDEYPKNSLDLGCGRGEWLELLSEHGFSPKGIDLDEGMLSACKERGFDVECDDALAVLKNTSSDSLCVVSAFHVVEHISFDMVREIVQESLRVLKPGGLLILETPNAENVTVGTNNFYMDPTHKQPIPSLLLQFVVDYAGFSRSKIVRLNGPSPGNFQAGSLLGVLEEVSPDYSIVAQKGGEEGFVEKFNEVFEQDTGVSLHSRASQYDEAIKNSLEKYLIAFEEVVATKDKLLESEIRSKDYQLEVAAANNKIRDYEVKIEEYEVEIARLEREHESEFEHKVESIKIQLDKTTSELHQLAETLEMERRYISLIKASTSWKVTAPLRMVSHTVRVSLKCLRRVIAAPLKRVLKALILAVIARPAMRHALSRVLRRHPRLWAHLIAFLVNRGVVEGGEPTSPEAQQHRSGEGVSTVRELRVAAILQEKLRKWEN